MEVAASTASLMNAIKGCVAEFTKIHMQHIKFQQNLQMMEIKHQYKMQELEARNKIYNKNDNLNSSDSTAMIEWETEGATEYIKFLANKNDAKNE
jgi:hypothetical protein